MMAKTITHDELIAALENVRILTGSDSNGMALHDGKATYPDALANDLFRHVEKNREPEYKIGEAYVDAYGEKWLYSGWYKEWYSFGSSTRVSFDFPKRPLRKLVPETSTKLNINWNKVNVI